MLAEELRAYYGSWAQMSRELQLGSTSYQVWLREGGISFSMQCLIEKKTKGRFKADEKHCKKKQRQTAEYKSTSADVL